MPNLGMPGYVAPIVVLVSVALAVWLYRLIAVATRSVGLRHGARVRGATALFLGLWLTLAFLLAPSTPPVDAAGRGILPTSFLFFGGISLVIAVALLVLSPTWRRVVDAVPTDALISTQVYRVIGGVLFLPLYASGILPGYFALPAGWGDLAVGLLALFVALAVRRGIGGARLLALLWNVFGFLDLVGAVGLGTGKLVPLLAPTLGTVSPVARDDLLPASTDSDLCRTPRLHSAHLFDPQDARGGPGAASRDRMGGSQDGCPHPVGYAWCDRVGRHPNLLGGGPFISGSMRR